MVRVLQVTARDFTVVKLLLPLIDRLTVEGYRVTTACSPGRYTSELADTGYSIREINIDRRIAPYTNARTVWQLYRLMRRESFDIVHVHTPIAAALGRVAAKLAGIPIIIYTAHGFYFHDDMRRLTKQAFIWIEKLLGRFATDMLFTQSQEDADTAIQEGIGPREKTLCIGNGVDIQRFTTASTIRDLKRSFGLPPLAPVVGFVGRLVAEKGVVELVEAFQQALAVLPDLYLLVVGDNLEGERDQATKETIRRLVQNAGLASRVVFPGYVEDIPTVMQAIDLFVLPSHREGMPRTIIEAMASGKPVVASDIRGCHEEVVHGRTGLLVPVRSRDRLAEAMVQILSDPALAHRMGEEGRRRAEDLFDERDVLDREIRVYQQLVQHQLTREGSSDQSIQASSMPYGGHREK